MFASFERNLWAFAGAFITGAVILGALREPEGIRAAGETYFGGLAGLAGALLRR